MKPAAPVQYIRLASYTLSSILAEFESSLPCGFLWQRRRLRLRRGSRRHNRRQAALPGTLVDFGVFLGGGGPGVVLKHAIAHQPLPLLVVAVSCHRRFHGVQQRLAVVVLELEAGSLSGCG